MTKSPSLCAICAMDQLKGSCRTQPAWREQQSSGQRDRIEARAAGKFSDVGLEGKPMAPIGTFRTCRAGLTMSAVEGRTDVPREPCHFRF
jgi:hypothetical protein